MAVKSSVTLAQMSLSKSKFWYYISYLHFSKWAAPLVEGWDWAFNT